MKRKYYIGQRRDSHTARELIYSESEPTYHSHRGTYSYAIGPFRTKRGAQWALEHRYAWETVAQAERLAAVAYWEEER